MKIQRVLIALYPSWAERQMKWLNDHLQSDPMHKYDPVP
jgi:hypothetical protein